MTFAIAAVLTDDNGRITMLADTKLTNAIDATHTRHIYPHPCLKIVIVDEEISVAFAGDNPESALRFVTRLRGRSAAEVVEALRQWNPDQLQQTPTVADYRPPCGVPSTRPPWVDGGGIRNKNRKRSR